VIFKKKVNVENFPEQINQGIDYINIQNTESRKRYTKRVVTSDMDFFAGIMNKNIHVVNFGESESQADRA
jgi:hypothetical protein